MKNLKDKVAVITGGSSGIGLGIAEALAAEGCNLLITGMNPEKAAKAAARLTERGIKAVGVASDTSQRDAADALANLAEDQFGRVDIVVVNAGVGYMGKLDTIADTDWDWVMGVNLRGAYLTCSAFLPGMLKAGRGGHFVFSGSEQSFGLPRIGDQILSMPIYTATKHALLGLGEAIRHDYREDSIGVTLLCPGTVATEIWDSERGRQAEFGARNAAGGTREALAAIGMSPKVVGRMTVEGIKKNKFYVITHQHIRGMVDERSAELAEAFDECDRWHAEGRA